MKQNNAATYPEKITDAYLCVLTAVFPLWVQAGGYTDITGAKYDFFAITAIIYISAMLLIIAELVLIGKAGDILEKFRHFSITQVCILAYVFCCCISAVLSEYGTAVWQGAGRYEGLKTILLYAGIFFLISYFGKFKKRYLYLLGASVLINTVIAILQYAGFNPFSLFPNGYTFHDAYTLYASAFLGTIGNVDILSAFLSLAVPLFYACYILCDRSEILLIPFVAGVFLLLLSGVSAGAVGVGSGIFISLPLLVSAKQKAARALTAGGLAALSAAVYKCLGFTYENRMTDIYFGFGVTSAALLVLAAIMIALAFVIKRSGEGGHWDGGRLRKVLAFCVVSGFLAALAVIRFYPFESGTLYEAHQVLNGIIAPEFGSRRIQIWQAAVKLIPEHLWFGGGPDTLAERMTFSFKRYNETLGKTVETFIDSAHNDYLNIFVNTGIFSLLFYLAALVSAALRALRGATGDRTVMIIMTALICYLVQIFFSFSICIVSPFFWAFFGLFEASLRENNKTIRRI